MGLYLEMGSQNIIKVNNVQQGTPWFWGPQSRERLCLATPGIYPMSPQTNMGDLWYTTVTDFKDHPAAVFTIFSKQAKVMVVNIGWIHNDTLWY